MAHKIHCDIERGICPAIMSQWFHPKGWGRSEMSVGGLRVPFSVYSVRLKIHCDMDKKLQLQSPVKTGIKRYSDWDKNQLIIEIERLRRRKKYGIVWEDKEESVVMQCKSELPVLKTIKKREIENDDALPMNILIEGDNYHALSVLNYTHKGKIDVIYIDPPYNTGNKDFKYNDSYVDAEDDYRHSKWLSYISKRLFLSRELLKKDGVIFISIDDNEQGSLRMLCNEIFGERNFVANLIWKSKSGGANDSRFFAVDHEYILAYAKNADFFKLNLDAEAEVTTSYNLHDDKGWYSLDRLDKQSIRYSPSLDYKIIGPDGKAYYPKHKDPKYPNASWRWGKETVKTRYAELVFKNGCVYTKNYQKDGAIPRSLLVDERFGRTRTGKTELYELFGREMFSNPKPSKLIRHLVSLVPNKDAIVLDFMAGSGTTGHAVLALNEIDNGKRRFILCTNNENDICSEVCYPRLEKIIEGYSTPEKEKITGLGGNLKYFKTAFVGAEPNDKNKEMLTREATDMLCMREDTFKHVKETKLIKIFKGNKRHTGIIFDEDAIDALKKDIAKIGGKWSVYIFSLSDDTFDEEFDDMKKNVTVAPIPEAILRVYRRIFQK
ncbi:MAG: site-specific DNA-methyltransferase [Patescibacteria group bacterium]|nr:site-specific DNA-methyltransferase [Patescibacteria group bacterium]